MISDDFYSTETISEQMDAIRSRTGEIMYLIKGDKRALLVDTCLGVGNIRQVVRTLTKLPVTVWLTHGHVDHGMGAPLFDEVYMNHADDEVYLAHSPLEERRGYIEAGLGAVPGSWRDAEYVPPKAPAFMKDLRDGDSIDLGGIHAEAYHLLGHTPGCMVVLIPKERVLITGDAANNFVFLFDRFSSTVEQYRQNVDALQKQLAGRYDRCFMMHHDMEAGGALLENMVRVCDDILNGNVDDVPFNFMGGHYYLAKKADSRMRRLDGGEGNIIYNKEKVRGIS